jgi:hypothetical protein
MISQGSLRRADVAPLERFEPLPLQIDRPLLSARTKDFLRELAFMYLLFLVYKLVRLISAHEVAKAFVNAHHVISLERHLRLFTEPSFQRLVLDRGPDLARLLNVYYVTAHFVVTIFVLVWLYFRHHPLYLRVRRLLVAMTAIGLVIHVTYPLAPPRMLPSAGFIDTGHLFGPSPYDSSVVHGVANELAAMPSLHFGWAVLVAWAVIATPRRRGQLAILLHPLLTLAAIAGTANHYWMDAVVALVILIAVFHLERLVSDRGSSASPPVVDPAVHPPGIGRPG